MTARRNLVRASAAVLAMLVVLVAACAGTALAAEPTIAIALPHSGISTNDQTLPFSGTTSDLEDAVTLDIYAGPSATGTPVQTPTILPVEVSPGEITWEIAPESPLAQGQYTAVAEQTDESETGRSAPVTFTIDTTTPAVTMSSVASPTKDATPTLSGAAGVEAGDDAKVSVTVYKGTSASGTVAATESVAVNDAGWSYTTPHLADGTYTAQATQEDEAGNVGKSSPVTFTVDTTPPAVTLHTPVSPTKDPTPTLAGAAGTASGDIAAVTVTIYKGKGTTGTVEASGAATVNGAEWTYTAPHLAEGPYTAQATQEDKAGNVGKSAADSFTVDTTPPAVTMNAVKSPTNNSEPTLSGAAGVASGDHPIVTVKIYVGAVAGGTPAQSASVTPSGAEWSYKATHLADGIYTAQAEQSDEAGNVGKSSAVTFTIDTTPPAVTMSSVPSPTNNATPTLTGAAGIAPGDDASVTVKIYAGAVVGGTPAQSASVTPNGAEWSYKATKLADGTYTAQAEQSDDVGNIGKSAAVTFTVDTVGPAVTMNAVSSPTKNSEPTLSGTAGVAAVDHPTVTVTIHEGTLLTGKEVASAGVPVSAGAWSYEAPHLADGTYTAQAAQSDEAGNVGTSSAVTFTVDTTPPAVTIVAPPAFTNSAEPTLSGAAGVASGDDAAVTVKVYDGSLVGGTVAASGGASVTGASWSYKTAHLSDGTYTAQAEQSDAAGNIGKSAAVTFTVDTTPPAVTIVAPPAFTNSAEPTLSGAAGVASGDDAAVTVKVYDGSLVGGTVAASGGASVTGASWSYKTAHLSDGTYTAQAEQSDAAGNLGKSTAVTFTVDTTPPAVTINALASPTNDATPTFTGAAGTATGDRPSVTVTIYEGSSVSGKVVATGSATVSGATWSYKAATLADKKYTAQATQSDEAGNVGKSTEAKFTVDTTPPVVSINTPAKPLDTSEPTLTGDAGQAEGDDTSVTVTIYEGSSVAGKPVTSANVSVSAGTWSYKAPHLVDGTYTAQAAQSDDAGNVGTSAPVTFKTPPAVSVTSPSGGVSLNVSRPTIEGTAGSTSEDSPLIKLKIYKGESISGTPVETDVATEGGHWTSGTSISPLPNGKYTVQAEQSDSYGNVSTSAPVKFTITAVVTLDTSGFAKLAGKPVTSATPSFDGTAGTAPGEGPVHVAVYSGSSASGTPVWEAKAEPNSSGAWTVGPVVALAGGGTYTVLAEQEDPEVTYLAQVTFTVDATPPTVTLTSPASGSTASSTSQTVGGAAGTEPGDLETVAVHLYTGSAATGTPIQTISAQQSKGSWSATFGGLSPGTYTAEAEQSDDVGNVGHSEAVTFTLTAPPVAAPATQPSPPVASFRWVPSAPHPGEPVTLISTSTDPSSPITGFAWAPSGNEVFAPGESALTTSFATAGAHLVQLRVTDANGLSSVAAETIAVTTRAPALIQPFPIVHMAGSYDAAGVKISLLTVQAPVGATVTVKCRGAGCPTKSESMAVASGPKSKAGTILITLKRFERPLRAGAILEIEVSDHEEIGKFTKFVIHHDKPPTRQDLCLNPAGTAPILCPS